jgi:hypothetical protein
MGDRQGGGERAAMDIKDDPMTWTMGRQIAKEQSTLRMMARDAEMFFAGIELVGRHDGTSGCWSAHAQEVARSRAFVCGDYYGKFRIVAERDPRDLSPTPMPNCDRQLDRNRTSANLADAASYDASDIEDPGGCGGDHTALAQNYVSSDGGNSHQRDKSREGSMEPYIIGNNQYRVDGETRERQKDALSFLKDWTTTFLTLQTAILTLVGGVLIGIKELSLTLSAVDAALLLDAVLSFVTSIKPNFRSFDLNDADNQWLASHF